MEIYGNILWKTLYINFMSFYGILYYKKAIYSEQIDNSKVIFGTEP